MTTTKRELITRLVNEITQEHKKLHDFYRTNPTGHATASLPFKLMFNSVRDGWDSISSGVDRNDPEASALWASRVMRASWLLTTLKDEDIRKLLPVPSMRYQKMKTDPTFAATMRQVPEIILEKWHKLQNSLVWGNFLKDLTPADQKLFEEWNTWIK